MPTINWQEASPSDSDYYSGSAQELRSLKSSLAVGLSASLSWPGSGSGTTASAGSVLPGTARALYDVESNYSAPSSTSTGAAQITSNTSRMFGGASANTMFLGSASLIEGTYVGQRIRWQRSLVTASAKDVNGSFGASDQTTFNFSFGIVYDVAPILDLGLWNETSLGTQAVRGMVAVASTVTTGGATILCGVTARLDAFSSPASVCTTHLFVISSGTVTV